MKFEPKGPPTYLHQRRALRKLIKTNGCGALLHDPGLGKSRVVLNYASILALKHPDREVKVLVIAPLAAVDTWILQAEEYVSEQVNVWAEALGGTMIQRIEALASRGGSPYKKTVNIGRGVHLKKSHLSYVRGSDPTFDYPEKSQVEFGPDVLEDTKPRLVIETLNIETFSSRARVSRSRTMADRLTDAVKRFGPDLIVLDESHKIKNASSNVSRVMDRLQSLCDRRIILTGTVMPHSPIDVFAQWRFLEPTVFGETDSDGYRKRGTLGEFKERYVKFGGWMGKEIVGFKNLDEMQELMKLNADVARKEDSLDLPPTSDVIVPVSLSAAEKKAYTDMKEKFVAWLDESNVSSTKNVLTQILRLRQITSGFITDNNGSQTELGSSKAKTVSSIVNDTLIGEKRVVVFAFFTHEIEQLEKILKVKGTEVLTVRGSTPSKTRQEIRKRFISKDPTRIIMVAQIKTMSLAVNELVAASHAVFASLSQQRDDFTQARDRLNRIGQVKPVTFWFTVAPGTIDRVILESHRRRTNLESAVLQHIRETVKES